MYKKLIKDQIDIIVLTYNHEKYVSDCINSILNQDYKKIKIHIIDDFSTDGTRNILLAFKNNFNYFINLYFNKKNYGSSFYSIINCQLKIDGEFWCIIEGDDYWINENKLSQQILALKSNKKAIACTSKFLIKNEVTKQEKIDGPNIEKWNYLDLIINKDKFTYFSHISTFMWRNVFSNRTTFLPTQYIKNPELRGDVFLIHSALMENFSYQVININIVTSCYRYTGHGVWSSLSQEQQTSINNEMMLKIDLNKPFKVALKLKIYQIMSRLRINKFTSTKPINYLP